MSELPSTKSSAEASAPKRSIVRYRPGIYRVLLLVGVLILANSLYLFGYTAWQDATNSRAILLASYQWNLLGHFGVGILFVVLAVGYGLAHLREVLRRARPVTVTGGVLALLACLALLVTGLALLSIGNSESNRWVFHVHRVAGLVGLVAYVAHRWYARRSTPVDERRRWGLVTAGLTAAFAAVHLVGHLTAEPPVIVYEQAFEPLDVSSDPFLPFEPAIADVDPASPFFPSPVTLASGTKLDPKAFLPPPLPDPAAVRAEFEELGFTHSFAIGAESCRPCHQDIVGQWENSAHRFSSFNNPFYTASVMGTREQLDHAAGQFCGACHDPVVMLAGDFLGELDRGSIEAQAGLTCTTCHMINRVHDVAGNGNFELVDNGEDPYLFPEATEGLAFELRKYLIKARPRDHKDFFQRPFYGQPEYCATCHKVNLDTPINGYKWLRGQDEYDAWHDSGVSRNAARTFYLPSTAQSCQDCHMPLEPAELGDLAATNGMVRSHRFPGVNTALSHVRGDHEATREAERFLEGRLRVDLLAIEHPRDGFVIDPLAAGTTVRPGDELTVFAQVRNQGVGHTFPGGTNDSNQGWLELRAALGSGDTGDSGDSGAEVLLHSGQIGSDHRLDPSSHQYRSIMLDENAEPVMHRDVQNFVTPGFTRVIGPGTADIARYRIQIPADADPEGALDLEARLLWRKFNQEYNEFSTKFVGIETPVLPITELAAGQLRLPFEAAGTSPAEPQAWVRANDLGIGLLLQGDTRRALAAFARVVELEPGRVDGYRNQARVHLAARDPEPARPLLERCEQLSPGDTQTQLWWAEYLVQVGELEQAIELYSSVLMSFSSDRWTWRRKAEAAFELRDYDVALASALQALRIDPEDAEAHYLRVQIYRATGKQEAEREARKAFEKYRIDDNAPQLVQRYRLADEVMNHEIDPLHVHDR
ncbi:MAG: tetratricopeptide repeat protein [Planctomycetota bacterium]|nr:tetratricopeptide repeat protein [Planctomycetota bacterium]